MTIGQNIKELRKARGLKQKDLGEKIGVSGAMIAAWEGGKRNPKLSTVRRFAVALDVSMGDIIGDNWDVFSLEEFKNDFMSIDNDPLPLFKEEDYIIDIIVGKAMDLSDEGRKKVVDYEDDLIMGGKYKRTTND